MKRFVKNFVTLLFTLIYGVSGAQIKFSENFYDFGKIAEDGGEKEHIFHFRNTSSEPVVLLNAYTSCGCTKVDYPKTPVRPGETLKLAITYEADKPGFFNKSLKVYGNMKGSAVKLNIIGRMTCECGSRLLSLHYI